MVLVTRNSSFLRVDMSYQAVAGLLNTLAMPIAIVIAKKVLGAGDMEVAVLQSAMMIGLVLSLFYSNWTQKTSLTWAFALPRMAGALALFSLIFFQNLGPWGFTVLVTAASILMSVSTPLLSMLYESTYPPKTRGKLVGASRWFYLLGAGLTSLGVGEYLELYPNHYKYIYFLSAVIGIAVITPFLRLPPTPMQKFNHIGLIQGFGMVVKDVNFSMFMLFQFILGVANLCGLFAFYLYVTNDEYMGLDFSTSAWIIGAIPPIAMLMTIRLWGRLFDKISIVSYRSLTNVVMASGFLTFFFINEFWGLVVGSFVWGVGRAGGQVAWTIGILEFAGGHLSAVYLRVHTFLTGIRGIFAPFFGSWLLGAGVTPKAIFAGAAFWILVSAVLTLKFVKVPQPVEVHG